MCALELNPVDTKTQVETRLFKFQDRDLRAVVSADDALLFCLSDVCACCDVTNTSYLTKHLKERPEINAMQGAKKYSPPSEEENKGAKKFSPPSENPDEIKGGSNMLNLVPKEQSALDKLKQFESAMRARQSPFKAFTNEAGSDAVLSSFYMETNGGLQPFIFITEAQLYYVMFRGRSEGAKRFTSWVCSEVLPTIRQHGRYAAPCPASCLPALPSPDSNGHYHVTYPQVLKEVANAYGMNAQAWDLIMWAIDRAKAQGYAQCKTKERELLAELEGLQKNAKASVKTVVVKEEDKEKLNEAWALIDDTQEELAQLKKRMALYESAVKSLLEHCSNASLQQLVKAAIDCII